MNADREHAVVVIAIEKGSTGVDELYALMLYMKSQGYELVSYAVVQDAEPPAADGRTWRRQSILAYFRR